MPKSSSDDPKTAIFHFFSLFSARSAAVVNASDLPPGFDVQVSEGVVQIKGSVICDECGGMRTPGHIGTIQQSLGGVVRAIPGVMRVDFDLSYGPDYPANAQ